MQTRCPYPDCKTDFELPIDSDSKTVGNCAKCHKPATFRPMESLKQMEKVYEYRKHANLLKSSHHSPIKQVTFTALVEDVRSLWNVGSIFRSADGAGFSKLYLCGITGCPPRKEIAKTSLGAEDVIAWEYHFGALDILPSLKEEHVQIVGLECTEDSVLLTDAIKNKKVHTPLCLIVGNEVSGLSAEVRSICDVICHLPMRGIKESLNVAVAFGIAAYLLTNNN